MALTSGHLISGTRTFRRHCHRKTLSSAVQSSASKMLDALHSSAALCMEGRRQVGTTAITCANVWITLASHLAGLTLTFGCGELPKRMDWNTGSMYSFTATTPLL